MYALHIMCIYTCHDTVHYSGFSGSASCLHSDAIFHSCAELIAGLSNGARLVPFDCSLRDEGTTPKSVRALLLRVLFPLFLLITYWVVVVLVWIMSNWRATRTGSVGMQMKSFITYLIIVTITVVFFAYNTITEELMRTVNCIDVHRESDEIFVQFAAVKDEQFWAEDTELICFKGKHTATAVFGILGLVFFSFGFIGFHYLLVVMEPGHVERCQFCHSLWLYL